MKEGDVNNHWLENKYNFPVVAAEHELPELVTRINDEIQAGLRLQHDDGFSVVKSNEPKSIGRHICIELAGKQLAIPLRSILEAGELQEILPLPLLPAWLVGITNIRGEIVSVINLAIFLGSNNNSHAKGQSYLVVHNDITKLAITIDRIVGTNSLYSLPTEKSETTDELVTMDYFAGQAAYEELDVVKKVTLFDLDGFLSSNRLRNFATA